MRLTLSRTKQFQQLSLRLTLMKQKLLRVSKAPKRRWKVVVLVMNGKSKKTLRKRLRPQMEELKNKRLKSLNQQMLKLNQSSPKNQLKRQ